MIHDIQQTSQIASWLMLEGDTEASVCLFDQRRSFLNTIFIYAIHGLALRTLIVHPTQWNSLKLRMSSVRLYQSPHLYVFRGRNSTDFSRMSRQACVSVHLDRWPPTKERRATYLFFFSSPVR